jgi:zinc transporter
MDILLGKQLPLEHAVHAYQLTGKGGVTPIKPDSKASVAQPFWLNIDYNDEESAKWFAETSLIADRARDTLTGECPRPRVSRFGDGTLITLRAINFTSDDLPDPLVGLRIYLTDNLIISSRHRLISAIDEINTDLLNGVGPASVSDWLVDLADSLTDSASEFIDDLHGRIIEFEDGILEQKMPERGKMALIRKQLIILRRYLLPQRDVFARLASEKVSWMNSAHQHRIQEISERLGRALDDIDGSIARTAVLSDEINNLIMEATNRRTYIMSLLAMLFLPASFLTGLFGVNLSGIPGADQPWAFAAFCIFIVLLAVTVAWWLKRSRWL